MTSSPRIRSVPRAPHRILLRDHLVRLAGLLRPLIQREWTVLVARFNQLADAELEQFLFGVDRVSLTAVREPLRELAEGRCFYCGDRAERQASHLETIAEEAHWERNPARSLGVARSIDLRLPADATLWQLGKRFVPVDRPELARVFAGAGQTQ